MDSHNFVLMMDPGNVKAGSKSIGKMLSHQIYRDRGLEHIRHGDHSCMRETAGNDEGERGQIEIHV